MYSEVCDLGHTTACTHFSIVYLLLLKSKTGPVTACKTNEENMIFNWSQTVSKGLQKHFFSSFKSCNFGRKKLFFLVTF